jgi:hypothetical protein
MKTQSPDTHPEIERMQIEAYRRMTPAERFRKIEGLNLSAQAMSLGDIRRRHPDASEREMQLRLASRSIPANLMRKAFGWDPDREGY